MRSKLAKSLGIFFLAFALAGQAAGSSVVFAEEGENTASDDGSADQASDGSDGSQSSDSSDGSDDGSDDEVFIPDEYYEPVQSNDVSGWPQGEAIQASAGIVMDLDTGALLYAKNIQRQLYPASITKIMTALLVLENTSPDDVITCTDAVYDLDDNASNIALQEGEQITVRDALYALMLQSANDAANALAVQVAGSISAFADMMNQRAAQLGCTVTHFANPSGLPNDDHYTCARDFALIASAAYSNDEFRKLISTTEYEIKPTNMTDESRYFLNHHKMIHTDSDYYYSSCTGGKTGFTEAAWNTLVTYAEKDGMRLVCVLLHGNGADQNYLETTDLLNYGFGSFTHVNVGGVRPSPTLADVMDVHYLGTAADLQAPELSQKVADLTGSGMVTIPSGNDESALSSAPFKGKDGTNALAGEYGTVCGQNADIGPTEGSSYYTFGGWPVGTLSVSVSPLSLNLNFPWQTASAVTMRTDGEGETGDKAEANEQANEQAWENVGNYVQKLDQKRQDFWERNRTAIILVTGTVIIALLLLIMILMIRSAKNYRLRKKMRQTQEEARQREIEIENMTTAQIEEELRNAMTAQGQDPKERPVREDIGRDDDEDTLR